jgi:hypothetical protein
MTKEFFLSKVTAHLAFFHKVVRTTNSVNEMIGGERGLED